MLTLVRSLSGWQQARAWSAWDQRAARLFVGSVDTQVLLGLTLYFGVSPIAAAARADLAAAWADPTLRFFGVIHPALMLLAFIAAHVAWVAARRAELPTQRHRRLALGALTAAAFLVAAIPWPFLEYGRPHVRFALAW